MTYLSKVVSALNLEFESSPSGPPHCPTWTPSMGTSHRKGVQLVLAIAQLASITTTRSMVASSMPVKGH